ncbi:MAG: tetratricopeptide repeat protein [Bacteroidia bacterium]
MFNHYTLYDLDTAFIYAKQMVEFAKEKGLKKYEAEALHNLAIIAQRKGKLNESLETNKKCLEIRRAIDDKRGIGRSLANIGAIHQRLGKHIESLKYYEEALVLFRKIGDQELIAHVLNNMGSLYSSYAQYNKAIDYFHEALEIRKGLGENYLYTGVLISTADFYMGISDYKQAKFYAEEALRVSKKINYNIGVSISISLIANSYLNLDEGEKAMDYVNQSILLAKKIENKTILSSNFTLKGYLYQEMGKTDSAFTYYRNAYEIAYLTEEWQDLFLGTLGMGLISIEKNQPEKAIEWCQKCLSYSKRANNIEEQSEALDCLYKAYKLKNDDTKALEYHESYLSVKDSFTQVEATKKMQQYEFENKLIADSMSRVDAERLKKEKEAVIAKSKQRKNRIQYSLTIIVVLILATAIGIIARFKISPRLASGLIFIFFILTFEFLLVVLDPWVDSVSNGEVGWKIAINTAIALVLFGIHQVSEKRLKIWLLRVDKA